MITIQSGKMMIPEEERFVGFAGDDHSISKQFVLPQTQITDIDAVCALYLRFDDDRVTSAPLSVRIADSDTILTWDVRADHLLKSGIVMAQLKITDGSGSVTHYSWDYFVVGASAEIADDGGEIDMLSRSEFEERMAQAVRDARATAPYIGDDGYWYVYSREQCDYVRSVRSVNVTVDSAVSASSSNPVENRAVKSYIDSADALKVDRTRTIAGVDLQDNITASELRTALSVPTKTSDLANDSGFLSFHQDISGKMNMDVYVPYDSTNDCPDYRSEDFTSLPDGQIFTSNALYAAPRYWRKYRTMSGSNTYSARELLTAHQDISGKMDLAVTTVPTLSGQTGPDTSSSAYSVLPDGQLFKCYLSGEPTYWMKETVARGTPGETPHPYRVALYPDIPTVPTKTSDLTNDSGFLTSHQDISGKMNMDVYVPFDSLNDCPNYASEDFTSLPDGQIFTSNALYAAPRYWRKYRTMSGSNTYSARELLTAHQDISGKVDKTRTVAGVDLQDNITASELKTALSVPTKTSDLTNDSGFLTSHQDISGKENNSNKVTALSAQSTDTQYPSAKCVYDALGTKAGAATTLAGYGITDAYTTTESESIFLRRIAYTCKINLDQKTVADMSVQYNKIVQAVEAGIDVVIEASVLDFNYPTTLILPLTGYIRNGNNNAVIGLTFGLTADFALYQNGVYFIQIAWQYGGNPTLSVTELK